MNSETQMLAEECAIEAGAIIKCDICHSNYIRAFDDDAERQAYARATNEWKSGSRGFRGMEREEVMEAVKSALEDANLECPSCSR